MHNNKPQYCETEINTICKMAKMKELCKDGLVKGYEKISYAKEGVETIRQKKWAEPLGQALSGTASICTSLGHFIPGVGVLGGALKIGSCLLNPKPSRADLQRTQIVITENKKGQM